MQNFNLEMLNLNFPGTRWRGLAFVGAPIKTCQGMHETIYPFFQLKGQNNQGNFGPKTQLTGSYFRICCGFH